MKHDLRDEKVDKLFFNLDPKNLVNECSYLSIHKILLLVLLY